MYFFQIVFLLQPGRGKVLHADSQAEVETFRQDTVDHDNDSEG